MRFLWTIVLLLASFSLLAGQSSEELNFLAGLPDGRGYREMLPSYLKGRAARLREERRRKIEQFSGMQDVNERRRYVRDRMLRALGGLPERTPLKDRKSVV